MTNKDAQRIAAKKKYLDSERVSYDLSGSMNFCIYCQFSCHGQCTQTYENQVIENICGKAYNKMLRIKERKNK